MVEHPTPPFVTPREAADRDRLMEIALHRGITLVMEERRKRYSDRAKEAIGNWRYWLEHIREATPEDIADMERLYEDTVIKRPQFERLCAAALHDRNGDVISSQTAEEVASSFATARTEFEEVAGLLHDDPTPDANIRMYLPPKGIVRVLYGPDGKLRGFYSVKTREEEVEHDLIQEFGWQPKKKYETKEDMPTNTKPDGSGLPIDWTSAYTYAAEAFSNPQLLALPGVLIVRERQENGLIERDSGKAFALKVSDYQQLYDMGKRYTLTLIYDIHEVNKVRFPSPVRNKFSTRLNQELGSFVVATKKDRFKRKDGVEIEAHWAIHYSDIDALLRHAYARQ